jgi:hypothetical protein
MYETTGELLVEQRLTKGLTQAELAEPSVTTPLYSTTVSQALR